MQKLLLASILLAHIVIPMWGAGDKNAVRGLKKTLACMMAFNISYLLAILFVYPRL